MSTVAMVMHIYHFWADDIYQLVQVYDVFKNVDYPFSVSELAMSRDQFATSL